MFLLISMQYFKFICKNIGDLHVFMDLKGIRKIIYSLYKLMYLQFILTMSNKLAVLFLALNMCVNVLKCSAFQFYYICNIWVIMVAASL